VAGAGTTVAVTFVRLIVATATRLTGATALVSVWSGVPSSGSGAI